MPLEAQMNIAREFFDRYDSFRMSAIESRRFQQSRMLEWLKPLLEQKAFSAGTAGMSAEGRPIPMYSLGNGPVKVLLWSQMHGDEPTATMAILDVMNFFAGTPGDPHASRIRKALSVSFLPMLNPDGAERFQRRTVQLIDMNRDAIRLETPEARALKSVCDSLKPDFGFNLHDQSPRLTVGQTKDATAIALLAPPYDESNSDNPVRHRAKQLASLLAGVSQQVIPGHVAKYNDAFEPRAFGDNFQKWGTSTILIESGGWHGDREKMFLRKINAMLIMTALVSIATGEYQKADLGNYEKLPLNGENFFDLIFRNVRFQPSPGLPPARLDVAVNFDEQLDSKTGAVILVGKIVDLGDLSTYGAFEEFDSSDILLDSSVIELDKTMRREEFLSVMGKA